MFDVGFSEVLVIALVALLVVGPEQLPKLARTIGLWVGRTRQFVHSVKADIDRELKTEELQRILKTQADSHPLEVILDDDTRQAMTRLQSDLSQPITRMAEPIRSPLVLPILPVDPQPIPPDPQHVAKHTQRP